MLFGVVFPGDCKEIQAKLVMSQPDLTWLEAGFSAQTHCPDLEMMRFATSTRSVKPNV